MRVVEGTLETCSPCGAGGVGHIAKSVMLEKSTLGTCFDFCGEDPYAFMLITNVPDGRARVHINGYRAVKGLL